MKKLLCILVVGIFAMTASAQITWNAKAGFGISKCLYSDGDNEDGKTHFVGKLGVGMEYPLTSNFSLMPSAEFALKGAKWGEKFEGWTYEETIDIYYFQIPVLGAYRFNLTDRLNLVAKAGPYFAYGFAGKAKLSESFGSGSHNEDYSESENLFKNGGKRFEVGLDFGVDLEFKRFVVGAEYEFGLTPLYKEKSEKADESYSIKNSAIYVTVGYKF